MRNAITRNWSGPTEFTGVEDIAPLGGPDKHEFNDYSLQRPVPCLDTPFDSVLVGFFSMGWTWWPTAAAATCSSITKEINSPETSG